jgi:hypothetical protein
MPYAILSYFPTVLKPSNRASPPVFALYIYTQATFIAVYEGDEVTFPKLAGTDYSLYTGYLNLFGW